MSTTPAASLNELFRQMAPVAAPHEQLPGVEALVCALERATHLADAGARTCTLVGPDGRVTPIPEVVFEALLVVAEVMARGDSITLVPVGKELTTQQAADLLNVSRQYFVRLLDEGEIPFTRTGTHRRVKIGEVLRFKGRRDRKRARALEELTEMSEELGGYKEFDPEYAKKLAGELNGDVTAKK